MKHISRSVIATMLAMAYMAPADAETGTGGNAAVTTNTNEATATAPTTTAKVELSEAEKAAIAEAKEKRHLEIKANFNNLVDVTETSFHFRKVKDENSKLETKRPTVVIPIPAPSVEGLIAIIEAGGKQLELLLEAARNVILDQAREVINENESINANNFPYDKMGWDYIANMPKADRRGGGIAKELWDDFAKDYIEIMPSLTGKTKESVELATKVFLSKFANQKTNKPVLKLLQQQLAIYTSNTTQGEQFTPVIEWLSNKLETLINTDETNLLLNL